MVSGDKQMANNRKQRTKENTEIWADLHGFYKIVNCETGRTLTHRGIRCAGFGTRESADAKLAEIVAKIPVVKK